MKCYRCQIEIQENMQFCPGCGAVLQVTDSLINRDCSLDKKAAADDFAGLYYGQRMSINEIAEIFTVSEDAVREKLSEMRKQLAMCVEAGGRAKTMDLAMPEYLMWLYTGLKAHSAECMSEVILHDVQKKAGDKKGKKAAKAVGGAAMAVAGESVGEVAKEGLKATITRIIAGLTATAVIGGGTGAAVKTYQENKAEEKLSGVQIQQDISTEIIQKDSVPESLESENSGDIVCDPQGIGQYRRGRKSAVRELLYYTQ